MGTPSDKSGLTGVKNEEGAEENELLKVFVGGASRWKIEYLEKLGEFDCGLVSC